ncbi:hypothetical protein D5086_022373, partial [Populus alba]
ELISCLNLQFTISKSKFSFVSLCSPCPPVHLVLGVLHDSDECSVYPCLSCK